MATTAMTSTPSEDNLIAAAMEAASNLPPETGATPRILSPTLEALDKLRRPRPATVCEGCPNSVWFTSPTEVKCYCRVMYLVTWSVKEPNQITACDGVFVGYET